MKTGLRSHTPTCFSVCPCDLFMVIAKAILTGNWRLCHSKGNSFGLGMNVILGMSTERPVSTILHCRSLLSIHLSNINRVPLQRPWRGLILRNSMRGTPCFRQRRCCGNPLGLSLLRYSVLNLKISSGFSRVSALASFIPSSGKKSYITSLMVSTSLLVGANIVLPCSQPGDDMFFFKLGKTSLQNFFIDRSSFLVSSFEFGLILMTIFSGILTPTVMPLPILNVTLNLGQS